MAIQLDSVVLSPSMQWIDRHSFDRVAQTKIRTLGGGLIVYSQALYGGRPVTLEAQQDTGWITKSMLDGLEALAEVSGAVYNLTVHDFTAQVIFRHEDSPALDFKPLTPKATPLSGDYYIGTIKLLTV